MANLNDVTTKLKEYKVMLDEELLTQQEFDDLKKQLLSETTQSNSGNQQGQGMAVNVESIKQVVTDVPNATGQVGNKSKMVAGLLGIFLGAWGAHNFYLGFRSKAMMQLIGMIASLVLLLIFIGYLTMIALSIWGTIEGILILCSKPGTKWHRDALGNELQD